MNVQERDQLLQFFSSLQRSAAQARDPVAEGLIRQRLAEGVSVYDLVQHAMGLTLALQAAQARLAQLQAQSQEQLLQLAQARAASALPLGPAAPPSRPASPTAHARSVWGQGLLRQVGGTAVGVAAGVVAGGLLLEGWQRLLGEGAAASSDAGEGMADAGPGLWDLGDDWT